VHSQVVESAVDTEEHHSTTGLPG